MNTSRLWQLLSGVALLVLGVMLGIWVLFLLLKVDLHFLPRADPLAKDTFMLIFSSFISAALIFSGLGRISLGKKNG